MGTTDDRARARRNVQRAMRMAEPPVNAAELARRAEIKDPQTVREFLSGARWPHFDTRAQIERALGLGEGTIDAWAEGRDAPEPAPKQPSGDDAGLLVSEASAVVLARALLARLEDECGTDNHPGS